MPRWKEMTGHPTLKGGATTVAVLLCLNGIWLLVFGQQLFEWTVPIWLSIPV
jgi:hypothetical protein